MVTQKTALPFDAFLKELRGHDLFLAHSSYVPDPSLHYIGVTTKAAEARPDLPLICYKGVHHDGHDSAKELLKKTTPPLLIIEDNHFFAAAEKQAAMILVKNARAAWALLEAAFWQHPQKDLTFIGVTGTNGKTSTTWMLHHLLRQAGQHSYLCGTMGHWMDEEFIPTTHTTPDPDVFFAQLARAKDSGISTVVMEVASHALEHNKLFPIRFQGLGFTSFSQDHLDLHGSMEAYLEAKLKFFRHLSAPTATWAICDSVWYETTRPEQFKNPGVHPDLWIYGAQSYGKNAEAKHLGVTSQIDPMKMVPTLSLALPDGSEQHGQLAQLGGCFSENFACSLILYRSVMGFFPAPSAWQKVPPVPGRLQAVRSSKPGRPLIFIDYAHTPDALEKALGNIRDMGIFTHLTCIFGCGGDRDRSKRPLMAAVAERLADAVIVTNDNPRTEDPDHIFADIRSGFKEPHKVIWEKDRQQAVMTAVTQARHKRCGILLAGKGHENYQIIATEKIPLSEIEISETALDAPRKWLVIGAGKSGEAAAELLAKCGEQVAISEEKKLPPLKHNDLTQKHIGVLDGGHALNHLSADTYAVVVSPGVPPSNIMLQTSLTQQLPIWSELDLGLAQCQSTRITGITGTNGKSTVSAMTSFALSKLSSAKVWLGGNFGTPLCAFVNEVRPTDEVVLEVSSYQLSQSEHLRPRVAVFVNFTPDHLQRHGDLRGYFLAKWRIVENFSLTSALITSPEVLRQALDFGLTLPPGQIHCLCRETPPDWLTRLNVHCYVLAGKELVNIATGQRLTMQSLPLQEPHNLENAVVAALASSLSTSVELSECLNALSGFKGLAHRCEYVTAFKGWQFINDSKSTNVDSTITALKSYGHPTILLLGGQPKGESFLPIAHFKDKIAVCLLFGAGGPTIEKELAPLLPCKRFDDLTAALTFLHSALQQSSFGSKGTILFSPAGASFDAFKNFEHRGETFTALVQQTFC